jgi:2-hydroxy-3-keto-5-methylthiopentenyl-1-phosphate phosphatase
MTNFLGDKAKDIEIVCNGGKITDRTWEIIWRDDTIYGNDKSLSKLESGFIVYIYLIFFVLALIKARQEATKDTIFVFCGDGVSDISAARHADILFARKDRDLEFYCKRENIPFIPFDTFAEVEQVIRNIVDGKSKLEKSASGFSKVVQV